MTLRTILIGIGVASLAGAAVTFFTPAWPAGIELAFFGVLLLLGTLFERRYRTRHAAQTSSWQRTGERFIDPTTGKLTEVRYDPTTGERAYVPVDGSGDTGH